MAGRQQLSEKKQFQIIELKRQGMTERAIAEKVSVPKSTVHEIIKRAAERGEMGFEPVLPGYTVRESAATYDRDGNLIRSRVTQSKASGDVFEMPEGQRLKEVSAYLDRDKRWTGGWVKTKPIQDDPESIAKAMAEAFKSFKGTALKRREPSIVHANRLTVYPWPDIHFGMLAWNEETGQSYDRSIAERVVGGATDELIDGAPPSETALIMGLGDFFHIDDQRNVTPTSQHQLDADGRFLKILHAGAWMWRNVVDKALQKHRKVIVVVLPGNHDKHAAPALALALSFAYEGDPRVEVVTSPSKFFFRRFGKVLIGAHHGDARMKAHDKVLVMAHDVPEDWGASVHRHFFFGHVHRETANEIVGVRVESFNTPAARDSFAASEGYRSGQSLQAITFDFERGLRCRQYVDIPDEAYNNEMVAA